MRMTKKITSIVLAVMMVVSMMSVMAFSANAVGDYVAKEDYLTFTAVEAGASVTLKVSSGSNLQYSLNGGELIPYTPGTRIDLVKGDSVSFRGNNTTFDASNHVSIDGKVACSGNVMSLRLDDDSMSQGLSAICFSNMFYGCAGLITAPELPETMLAEYCYERMFYACTNLTAAPELPATALATGCYSLMFAGCVNLTTAPELPATTMAPNCYYRMFYSCRNLTTAPELPATTLALGCYGYMFAGCSSIKLSETKTAEYSIPYSVPSGGDATGAPSSALRNMFVSTGGTFAGTPELNRIYYRPAEKYTVTWKNGDTVLATDEVEEGETPSYTGEAPTKASDSDKHYTFSGWSDGSNTYAANALPEVSGDVTYTAQFTAVPKHTVHTYTANPTFNWTQDASTGDWNCDKLTLTCTGCDLTQDYDVTGFFGASAVTCTANTDGSFTYSVSKTVDGTKYEDSKTNDANGVVKSVAQLKAAAKKGGSWELGADLTGVTDVQCANGFVLDGKDHTVTRHANVSTQAVFRTTANPAEITLKNLTIDGIAGQSDLKPAIATKQSNPSAGNVINLENVTITNYDFDASNNGVVLAWGQATVNMTNCNIDTESTYDVWGGAASTVNVSGGEVGTVYLNGGTASAELTNGAVVDNFAVPEGKKIKDNGNGTYTVVDKVYVAQVGSTKYESLQDALDVVPDGGTVTVLKDITTSGNIFADGYVSGGNRTYTVDLGGYTVSGGTFIVADGNDVTFTNGTIESASYAIQNTATATIDSTATVKSTATNASAVFGAEGSTTNINGTVEGNKYGVIARGGTLNVAGKVTATNDDGRAITLNKGGAADINDGADIDGAYGVVVHKDANLNVNGGDIAGVYHAVSGNGTAADGPYTINVTGGTLTATNGAGIYNPNAQGTLKISGGNITGSTTAVAAGTNSTNSISGGTFSSDVDIYAAPGFVGKQLSATTFGVEVDTNPLGTAPIIGFQKKAATGNLSGNDIDTQGVRIVTKVEGCDLTQFDEYGYVVAKVSSKQQATANFNNLKAYGGNGEKTIKCNGTVNTVDGYGTPYVTLAVNGMNDGDQVAARFYAIKDGVTYYSNYVSTARYNGIIATY